MFPFIIVNNELSKKPNKINHEKIHIHQQVELFVIIFYIWYVIEFILRTFKYFGQIEKSYRNISFEREAYSNENNLYYLSKRKWYSFLKYI